MTKKGFTLLEIIVVITGFFLLMVIVLQMYNKMLQIKYSVEARQTLIEDSYLVFEKINLLLKDNTIDYEEYFNRQMVGCDSRTDPFTRDIGTNGYCDAFTAYGNRNAITESAVLQEQHQLYYCSSLENEVQPHRVVQNAAVETGAGCFVSNQLYAPYYQSYGQYAEHFWDRQQDVDLLVSAYGDEDDLDLGMGPDALYTTSGVQELYLIGQDETTRTYLRRKLVATGDRNRDGVISGDSEYLYTIQMLQLRGFDAGDDHNFVLVSSGLYDGAIDTWACDYANGYMCHGDSLSGVYSDFHLPADSDDGRVDLFDRNLTVSDRSIRISPTKDPAYARAQEDVQINPFFTIQMTTKLYGELWYQRLRQASLDDFQLSLQTTFNTKNFYTK